MPNARKPVSRPQITAHYFKFPRERKTNSHQLKHNDYVIGLFALEPLQIRIPDCTHAHILAIINHWIQLYNLVLCDVPKIMITMMFHFDLSRKTFRQKILSKNYFIKWWKRKRFKNCRFHIPAYSNNQCVGKGKSLWTCRSQRLFFAIFPQNAGI